MAEITHAKHRWGTFEGYVRGFLSEKAARDGVTLPPPTEIAEGNPLPARVNHGRWIVDCPDCAGAQLVFRERPLILTICPNCWNAMVGGKWRRVILPANAEEIEAALLIRPLAQNRHWVPGESVRDLWQENSDHGLLVLPR